MKYFLNKKLFLFWIFYFFWPHCYYLFAAPLSTMAVIIIKSPTLSVNEQTTIQNVISNGFADTEKYQIVDADTLNKMLEDEVAEALLLGNESKLDEIQKKYQVDVLVNVSSKVESMQAIGGYSMASATVTMASRKNNSEMLFNQKTSEPQNGYYGMPEWIGTTAEACRKVALQAAVADVFQELNIETVNMPFPLSVQIKASESNLPSGASTIHFLDKHHVNSSEAAQLAQLVKNTMGNRSKISSSILDAGKRIAAIGIKKIDIDLQRHRRMDTAEFQIFDYRKRRKIRSFELPRDIKGIRRPRSREIVDFAFAPSGRFIVIVSKHPVIWFYDILNGSLLYEEKIKKNPKGVYFSKDGLYVKITGPKGDYYYHIHT